MTDNVTESIPHILMADDEIGVAADLEHRLVRLGYSVLGNAASAQDALKLIERHRPDLVMMGIDLGGKLKGIEAAESIMAKWGTPVVFLASSDDADQLEHTRLPYPFGFLLKPIQDRELKITLGMALNMAKVKAERKNFENAMIEEAAWRRMLVQGSRDGIVVLDQTGKVYEANKKFADILGYSDREVFDLHVWDWDDRWTREQLLQMIEDIDETGDHFETRHRRRDGSSVDVEISTNGAVIGGRKMVFCVCRDITERKQAEKILAEREKYYRTILKTCQDGIWMIGPDGSIRDVNDAYCLKLGYTREEFLRLSIFDIDVDEKPDKMTPHIEHLFREGSAVFEARHRRKDGSLIDVEISASHIEQDGGRFVCFCRDITDRKHAHEQQVKSHNLLQNLARMVPGVIYQYRLNPDGSSSFPYASPGMNDIYEVTPEEVREDATPVFGRLHPDDHDRVAEAIVDSARTLNTFYCEFRVNLPWQGLRWRWSQAQPERTAEGGTLWHGIISDITDRKLVEAEKEKLQAQLIQARKMEAVGTLAGGISHDFNNLLQAINGYTHLLMMDKNEKDLEFSSLKAILNAGERAANLVRQLLLFSRKTETERKSIQLNAEIEQALMILGRTIPKMIAIETRLGSRIWPILADPVQIEQILLNLGTNAADAMPDGGQLSIETANFTVDEEYPHTHLGARPGRYVLLTVTDSGTGMDKNTVEHIFEPFFTTKEIGKGTGLGLASVFGIVKSHGGYIHCYSEVGQGTTFKIYLPAIDRVDTAGTSPLAAGKPPKGTETVLLVDDEDSIRELASQALKRFGYTSLTASSGENALEICSARPDEIDLVIMDLGMPGMGGHKCLERLLRISPAMKVLIASGYSGSGQVDRALHAGAAGFVAKPYQLNDMLHKVRAVLDRKA